MNKMDGLIEKLGVFLSLEQSEELINTDKELKYSLTQNEVKYLLGLKDQQNEEINTDGLELENKCISFAMHIFKEENRYLSEEMYKIRVRDLRLKYKELNIQYGK